MNLSGERILLTVWKIREIHRRKTAIRYYKYQIRINLYRIGQAGIKEQFIDLVVNKTDILAAYRD
ncbi:hypothetical protein Xbed_00590 [Xenorhabdus beddingii]|uniref:Uncharacterized protein n=1 Tax=Xenorhabdus beddingii TaxID=40578 RepID=A0A1Y2ST26_9GAMM|nr:hypothetical protein Xbed_00590 [Xenorhabdus beddingii]